MNLLFTWAPGFDGNRKALHCYLSKSSTTKGEFLAKLAADADAYLATDVTVGSTYWFRVVAVNSQGAEEDWQSAAVLQWTVKGVKPPAASNAGGAKVEETTGVRVTLDPPDSEDPPSKVEVIQGDADTGQYVGEFPVEKNEWSAAPAEDPVSVSLPASAGLGAGGGTETYTVRFIGADGRRKGTGATFSARHLDPNAHVETVLASITGATLTGFTSVGIGTESYEIAAGDGPRAKAVPTKASATSANGWGTWNNGGLLGEYRWGAGYHHQIVVESEELDLGATKEFMLELWDNARRKKGASKLGEKKWKRGRAKWAPGGNRGAGGGGGNAGPGPAGGRGGPGAVGGVGGPGVAGGANGPAHAGKVGTWGGGASRPMTRTKWEYKVKDTSPITDSTPWRRYVPGAYVSGRYAKARMTLREPTGQWQATAPQVRVRAWEQWQESGVPQTVKTVSTAYTVENGVGTVLATSAITATIPPASALTGRVIHVKSAAASAELVVRASSGNIDGAATQTVGEYEGITVVSDGSNWWVI